MTQFAGGASSVFSKIGNRIGSSFEATGQIAQSVGQTYQGNVSEQNYIAQARESRYNATGIENAARYNAGATEFEAEITARDFEDRARQKIGEAGQLEGISRKKSRDILGEQRAAISQAGIGRGGSAGKIEAQSLIDSEMDALLERYKGDIEARGMMTSATRTRYAGQLQAEEIQREAAEKARLLRFNASMLKKNARYAKKAGELGGFGSYLSAVSTMFKDQ